ncbi:ABC transporter substrate-binding protein [Streptomyces sp. NPDC017964]|uniref:ABC transporter substrate-binding protein n=1 Tax=Streptomyces sp. NPDC017964 TaxID=3365022 RepID=UPI003798B23C
MDYPLVPALGRRSFLGLAAATTALGTGSSVAGQLKGNLRSQGMYAVDDRTVRFALDKKYVYFPNAMATQFVRIYRAGTKDFAKPVGTGPFVFESFAPGQSFAATRFDKYWGDAPKVERVDVINYAEDSTRLSALINGDIDVLLGCRRDSVAGVGRAHRSGGGGVNLMSPDPQSVEEWTAMQGAMPAVNMDDERSHSPPSAPCGVLWSAGHAYVREEFSNRTRWTKKRLLTARADMCCASGYLNETSYIERFKATMQPTASSASRTTDEN